MQITARSRGRTDSRIRATRYDGSSRSEAFTDDRSDSQSTLAEKAIEHICFLADVNRLYDTALGLYNLDVAILVAQQSQKDPREYLPHLQTLQELPELRRKYSIDNDLKRYGKALLHLFDLGEFDELKAYMSKHELHSEAIKLYRYQSAKLNELVRIQADFSSSRNRFKEAGIAYEYLSDYNMACDAYRNAGLWRECLASATLVPLPAVEIQSLAESLVEGLVEVKEHSAAATIYLDYLSDVENGIKMFCKGHHYAEALRTAGLKNRRDLLESTIDAGLAEGFGTMTELLADMKGQLNAQIPRLQELRAKKAEDPRKYISSLTSLTDRHTDI